MHPGPVIIHWKTIHQHLHSSSIILARCAFVLLSALCSGNAIPTAPIFWVSVEHLLKIWWTLVFGIPLSASIPLTIILLSSLSSMAMITVFVLSSQTVAGYLLLSSSSTPSQHSVKSLCQCFTVTNSTALVPHTSISAVWISRLVFPCNTLIQMYAHSSKQVIWCDGTNWFLFLLFDMVTLHEPHDYYKSKSLQNYKEYNEHNFSDHSHRLCFAICRGPVLLRQPVHHTHAHSLKFILLLPLGLINKLIHADIHTPIRVWPETNTQIYSYMHFLSWKMFFFLNTNVCTRTRSGSETSLITGCAWECQSIWTSMWIFFGNFLKFFQKLFSAYIFINCTNLSKFIKFVKIVLNAYSNFIKLSNITKIFWKASTKF